MLAADVLNPGAPFSLVAMKVPADSMVAHMAHVYHMPATPKKYIYFLFIKIKMVNQNYVYIYFYYLFYND